MKKKGLTIPLMALGFAALQALLAEGFIVERLMVDTTAVSRYAENSIEVEIINEHYEGVVQDFSFELPVNTRVTFLIITLESGAVYKNRGVVEETTAIEMFADMAIVGKTVALLRARDMINYRVDVALQPYETIFVEIVYEEFLHRKDVQLVFGGAVPIKPHIAPPEDPTLGSAIEAGLFWPGLTALVAGDLKCRPLCSPDEE